MASEDSSNPEIQAPWFLQPSSAMGEEEFFPPAPLVPGPIPLDSGTSLDGETPAQNSADVEAAKPIQATEICGLTPPPNVGGEEQTLDGVAPGLSSSPPLPRPTLTLPVAGNSSSEPEPVPAPPPRLVQESTPENPPTLPLPAAPNASQEPSIPRAMIGTRVTLAEAMQLGGHSATEPKSLLAFLVLVRTPQEVRRGQIVALKHSKTIVGRGSRVGCFIDDRGVAEYHGLIIHCD